MRKYFSVFMLFVRSVFLPVLVLILLLVSANLAVYFIMAQAEPEMLENMLSRLPLELIFGVSAALTVIMLCLSCTGRDAKPVYTLARLSLSKPGVFLCQSFCNVVMLFLVLAAEVLSLLFICSHHLDALPEEYKTGQSLFLAFYRSDLLHSVLPLEDIIRWSKNAVMIMGMAVICANSSYKLRLGKKAYILPTVSFVFAAETFVSSMGNTGLDGFCIVVFAVISALIMAFAFTGEEVEDDEIEESL